MSRKEFSDAELRRLTNIDELLGAPVIESKAELPAAPAMGEKNPDSDQPMPLRSTTDPLQVYFASADIAGGLQKPTTKPFVKAFAWIFLAGPFIAYALMMLYTLVSNFPAEPTGKQLLARLFGLVLTVVIGGFWPFVLMRKAK
jgi:hypothetical protein